MVSLSNRAFTEDIGEIPSENNLQRSPGRLGPLNISRAVFRQAIGRRSKAISRPCSSGASNSQPTAVDYQIEIPDRHLAARASRPWPGLKGQQAWNKDITVKISIPIIKKNVGKFAILITVRYNNGQIHKIDCPCIYFGATNVKPAPPSLFYRTCIVAFACFPFYYWIQYFKAYIDHKIDSLSASLPRLESGPENNDNRHTPS
jgi:hypothetical protein